MTKKLIRLYQQFQPKHYALSLNIDKEKLVFNGKVHIDGRKVGRPSKRLTLHQKDLKISKASLVKIDKTGSKIINLSRINKQNSLEEIRLHSEEMIYPGDYKIELDFSGPITKSMHGIYSGSFKHKGKDKIIVSTQFESHHAREAFPCIDEPEAKATFDLELTAPNTDRILSNTPILKEINSGKNKTISFETTPVMSTYLVAFAIGEFHGVNGKTKDGVEVSTWANIEQPTSHLTYANSEAIKILEFFTNYFKTPYPLKKLDLLAVTDFDSLAMENWGLIIFREIGLLADPVNRSISAEQLITLVIAHEISHQWFGNLVTMKWWDDLWLNESFASIMENVAPDALHPDWNQWEDFVTGRILSCSHRDIYKDVQPVGVTVKHPDEIMTLFDPAIVYAKGARILNMLLDYVGKDNFRLALANYFKKHAYQNTTREDLWNAMSLTSNTDVSSLMTPWITQSGQPRLTIKRSGSNLELNQERFLMDGEDKKSFWPIPLLADRKLEIDILDKKESVIKYQGKDIPLFNINGSGHYISHYLEASELTLIKAKIIDQTIRPISRITFINDLLLLTRAGYYRLDKILDIIQNCSKEPRDAVWSMFVRIIAQAQTLTDGNKEAEQPIKHFKSSLASYWYDKLGWQDSKEDDPNIKHLRNTALALSVTGENKKALTLALDKFESAGSVIKLSAEQRALIAGAAVRHGPKNVINKLMKEYENTQNPDVIQSITMALCSTKNKTVAEKLINWGLSENGAVRQQDIDHWYAYLMRNHHTREIAWSWLIENWDYLSKIFAGAKHLESFVWYSAGAITTNDWQDKFINFFEPKIKEPGLKRNIQIGLSEISVRVDWRQREEKLLIDYFKIFNAP